MNNPQTENMYIKYVLKTRNKIIRARNHREFVTKMRKHDYEGQKMDNETYMRVYAGRRKLYDKIDLNCSDEVEFVRDLLKHKLLTIVRKRTLLQSLFFIRSRKKPSQD